ncbi:MAG: hypothetical protein GY786_10665 [Proteobacteria bacterium]|nr:hypothetical protein [Pseudomonadota bacterium]
MKKIITLVLISFLSISILSANTLEQAVEEAAHKLRESGKLDPKRHILSVGMVNFHSKKKGQNRLKDRD